MIVEKLKRANELQKQIDFIKESLKDLSYTQSEKVTTRKSYLKFNGIENDIEIPENLFRFIGQIISFEYKVKLQELENEFNNL